MISIIFVLIGILLLYYGAEILVKGSSNLAIKVGISPMLVGLTVVAFGTSSPELFVSFIAGMQNSSDIALGNVVGSNICNIGLILGLASIIMPVKVDINDIKLDLFIMIAASLIVWLMILDKHLSHLDGIILLILIISYLFFKIKQSIRERKAIDLEIDDNSKVKSKGFYIFLIIAGLITLIIGSNLFIDGAISIARYLGVSNAIIGLSLVAFGTSLPELATSIIAAIKKQDEISLGNIIGSNIFNILFILGFTSTFFQINAGDIKTVDYLVMLFTSLIIIPMGIVGKKYSRIDGFMLLLIYIAYIYYLYINI
jgi:cation:H+ antiporter